MLIKPVWIWQTSFIICRRILNILVFSILIKCLFFWTPKSLEMVTEAMKRHLLLGRKAMTNLDNILKSRDITLPTKVRLVKAMFSSSHIWMWELDYKESWVPKDWCCLTVVLEKTLESPLGCKEIQTVHPKGNQ